MSSDNVRCNGQPLLSIFRSGFLRNSKAAAGRRHSRKQFPPCPESISLFMLNGVFGSKALKGTSDFTRRVWNMPVTFPHCPATDLQKSSLGLRLPCVPGDRPVVPGFLRADFDPGASVMSRSNIKSTQCIYVNFFGLCNRRMQAFVFGHVKGYL